MDPRRASRPGPGGAVDLGQRLELREAVADIGRDRTIQAVLEALGSGSRPSWLLVYDNATQPLDLQRYMPGCVTGGHIIVTSRLRSWPGYRDADSIQVSPFTTDEAVYFLRRRVAGLASDEGLSRDEDTRRSRKRNDSRAPWATCLSPSSTLPPTWQQPARPWPATWGRFEEDPRLLLSEQPADFPAPVSGYLDDVGRVANRRCAAPVQSVCVLLARADSCGYIPAERARDQRFDRAARIPLVAVPVPRCG